MEKTQKRKKERQDFIICTFLKWFMEMCVRNGEWEGEKDKGGSKRETK